MSTSRALLRALVLVLVLVLAGGTILALPRGLPSATALAITPVADRNAAPDPALDPAAQDIAAPVATSTPTATAATPASATEVLVDSLVPVVPQAGGDITVTGEVANRDADALEDVQVRLRISRNALDRRGQVDEIADGEDTTSRTGIRLERTLTDVTGELAPGARARFRITVPVDDLRLGNFGVYVLGVEALASEERAGLTRTFLPWVPAEVAYSPARLTWAWPLVDRPHRDADGVFTDDSLAESLRPGGRLQRLLTSAAASRLPVAWFLDPMLLEDVAAMTDADGYLVRGPRGPVRGTGSAAAAAWLGLLRTATSRADVHALPYADPDAVAVTRAGQGRELLRATGDGARVVAGVLGRRPRTDVSWPVEGLTDYPTGRAVHEAGARAAVLRDSALPPRPAPSYTLDGRAVLPLGNDRQLDALLYDERLSALAGELPPAGQGALVLQRFLAETAMVVAERPSDERTVLLAPPRRWDPPAAHLSALLQQTRDAPWLRPAALADLRNLPAPPIARDALVYPAEAQARELPGGHLEQVDRLQRDVGILRQIVDGGGPAGGLVSAVQRLRSSAYRDGVGNAAGPTPADVRADIRADVRADVRTDVVRQQRRVRVVPGSVTLGDREGTIPVTVVNDFDQPVQVRLALNTTSPKLVLDGGGPVTVPPRRNRTVLVPATAEANGMVPVAAQLATPQGTAYGEAVELRVRVFFVPAVGLYVTAGAAALLFARAALALRRRMRGRGRRSSGRRPVSA